MCVVGLPVARYVYSFGAGEASGHWHNRLARRADNSEVSGSIPECPTIGDWCNGSIRLSKSFGTCSNRVSPATKDSSATFFKHLTFNLTSYNESCFYALLPQLAEGTDSKSVKSRSESEVGYLCLS